jgi:hypothetical protein
VAVAANGALALVDVTEVTIVLTTDEISVT